MHEAIHGQPEAISRMLADERDSISTLTEIAFVTRSGTPSPGCGAEKGAPAVYRENRHWTMFRSH